MASFSIYVSGKPFGKKTELREGTARERFAPADYTCSKRLDGKVSEAIAHMSCHAIGNICVSGCRGSGKTKILQLISEAAEGRFELSGLSNGEFAQSLMKIYGKYNVCIASPVHPSSALASDIASCMIADLEKRGIPRADGQRSTEDELLYMLRLYRATYPDGKYLVVIDDLDKRLLPKKGGEIRESVQCLLRMMSAFRQYGVRMLIGVGMEIYYEHKLKYLLERLQAKREGFYCIQICADDWMNLFFERCLKRTKAQKAAAAEVIEKKAECSQHNSDKTEQLLTYYPFVPEALTDLEKYYIFCKNGELLSDLSEMLFDDTHGGEDNGKHEFISLDRYWRFLYGKYGSDERFDVSKNCYTGLTAVIDGSFSEKEARCRAHRLADALCFWNLIDTEQDEQRGLNAEQLSSKLMMCQRKKSGAESESRCVSKILTKLCRVSGDQFITCSGTTGKYSVVTRMGGYSRKITLDEISEKIKISRTTLYKVINGKGYVSEGTRTIVEEALKKYNYVPNYNARDLANHKKYRVAYIGMAHHGSTFFSKLVQKGIHKALNELEDNGLEVISAVSHVLQPEQQIVDIENMLAQGIRNFVIVPSVPRVLEDEIKKLREMNCKIIYLSRYVEQTDRVFVGIDYPKSGRLAAEMMSKIMPNGGKIAVTTSSRLEDDLWVKQRYEGFADYFKDKPEYSIVCLRDDILDEPSAEQVCQEIIDEHNDLNAIYDISYKSECVARRLVKLHLDKEIHLVGFDLYDAIVPYVKSSAIDIIIGQSLSTQAYDAFKMMFFNLCYNTPIENGDYNSRLDVIVSSNYDCFDI